MRLRVRSSIPGRVRLDVPLLRSPGAARAAETALAALPDVRAVRVSPVSAGVLVLYDPDADLEALLDRIDAALEALDPTGIDPATGRPPLGRLLQLAVPERGVVIAPVLLTLGAHSATMLQNLVLISSTAVANGDTPAVFRWLGITDPRSQLRTIAVTTVALTLTQAVAQHRRAAAWQRLSRHAEHRLRAHVFTHLEAQDLAFFDRYGTGSLLSLLTDRVESMAAFVEAGDRLLESAMTVVIGGSVLARTSPGLALLVAAAVPFVALWTRVLGPRTKEAFVNAIGPASNLSQALENILTGIVEVKSFSAEDQEAERVSRLSRRVATSALAAGSAASLQSTVIESTLYLGGAGALAHGANLVLSGRVHRAQFTRTMYWIPTLMRAFGATVQLARTHYGASASAGHLAEVLDSAPAIHGGTGRLEPASVRGDVRIDEVSFGYDRSHPVLRDLSIRIPAGASLGIVGPNGSGKSTLLKLLLRFYEADRGRITIDDHDIRDLPIDTLRGLVSLVSQEVYIFDDTLAHNVRYGRPDASDDELVQALAWAGAAELVDRLPDGLNSELGERGHRLSGGQRQRVALARALLKGAPILALDEATSHLDYEAEAALKSTLRTTASGKTVLLIAHRLSSVRDLDEIVVLDRGTILERGTHQSLLEQRGLYHRMWQQETR